ncbi:MAG TPA: phosphotransferase [Pseudonocardiaceae bacterium]
MPDLTAESTPWGDPDWRERALVWVRDRVAAHGATVLGRDEPRLRPWSITMRLRTSQGPVWFKANPPGSRFEPALTKALSRWVPERVLTPLAIDADEGWSLLPDGGTVLREVPGAQADLGAWEELLCQYAVLQRAVAPHVPELLRVGVPDLRASELPARFDQLATAAPVRAQVGASGGITAEQYALLSSARPRLIDWCAELAASPVPATLDHSDLHEGQVFVADNGRLVFFDWGDAAIGHPFTSLLPVYRMVARRGPDLDRLRDAYLEPWTAEYPVGELRAAVEAAVRLGGIARALSWWRVFPQALHVLDAEHGQSIAHWLLRVLGQPARM